MHLGQDMYLEEVCWISLLFGGSLWAIFIRGYVFPGPFCSASVIPRIPNTVGIASILRHKEKCNNSYPAQVPRVPQKKELWNVYILKCI